MYEFFRLIRICKMSAQKACKIFKNHLTYKASLKKELSLYETAKFMYQTGIIIHKTGKGLINKIYI